MISNDVAGFSGRHASIVFHVGRGRQQHDQLRVGGDQFQLNKRCYDLLRLRDDGCVACLWDAGRFAYYCRGPVHDHRTGYVCIGGDALIPKRLKIRFLSSRSRRKLFRCVAATRNGYLDHAELGDFDLSMPAAASRTSTATTWATFSNDFFGSYEIFLFCF